MVSSRWPDAMLRRCRTFIRRTDGSSVSASISGKNDVTRSSIDSRPSAAAKPIAVDVKLLLRE